MEVGNYKIQPLTVANDETLTFFLLIFICFPKTEFMKNISYSKLLFCAEDFESFSLVGASYDNIEVIPTRP